MKINTGVTITVACAYSPEFIRLAPQIGGKWDPYLKVWSFPATQEGAVRKLCMRVFDYDGTDPRTCTVEVDINKCVGSYGEQDCIIIGGDLYLRKFNRDETPRLSGGAFMAEGELLKKGGSRNYPAITASDGAKMIIPNVSQQTIVSLVKKHPEVFKIVN